MSPPRKPRPIKELAKHGQFEELKRRVAAGDRPADLANIFARAVTDFRTVPRNPGHFEILRWCLDQGLRCDARAGPLGQSILSLAAMAGNNEIVAYLTRDGVPDEAFAWASLGRVDLLRSHAARHDLAAIADASGFNLLFDCAASALGRRDDQVRRQLTDTCRCLLDHGVDPAYEVACGLPIFPAFLCAAHGGNLEIMQLLAERGGLSADRTHQVIEHALEPHQRSGDPFFDIAEWIVRRGFNINALRPDQGRSLLHGAANRGSIQPVRWLLDHGADPNRLDDRGCTPLRAAAMRNTSTTVIALLIAAGAQPAAQDALGKTPRDYARENHRRKIVDYFDSQRAG